MTHDLELTSTGLVPRAQVNALLSRWKERILARIGKAVATSGEEVMAIGKTIGDVVTLARAQFDQLRAIGAELDPTRAADVTNIARVLDRHDKELTAFIAEFGRKLSDNDERIRSAAGMSREILAIGGQVGEVSLQARLLSVNAQIEAAHLGAAGGAVSVIGSQFIEMSRAIENANQRIAELANALSTSLPAIREQSRELLEASEVLSKQHAELQGRLGELQALVRTSLESGGDHVSQILALSLRALSHLQFQDPMVQDLLEIDVQIAAMAAEEGFDCPARPGLSRMGAQQRLETDEVGQAAGDVVLF